MREVTLRFSLHEPVFEEGTPQDVKDDWLFQELEDLSVDIENSAYVTDVRWSIE